MKLYNFHLYIYGYHQSLFTVGQACPFDFFGGRRGAPFPNMSISEETTLPKAKAFKMAPELSPDLSVTLE